MKMINDWTTILVITHCAMWLIGYLMGRGL